MTSDETAGTVRPAVDVMPDRVAARRHDLGLSVEDVARRTGLPGEWVNRVEGGLMNLSGPALARLASALETTVADLLAPRGSAFTQRTPPPLPGYGPGPARELVKMNDEECHAHLLLHMVGRIAALDVPDPFLLPVNYVMLDRNVLLCTAADSPLAGVEGPVLFEVDEIVEQAHIGWSVLVRGALERMDAAPVPELAEAVRPWPRGRRDVCLRIRPTRVTGRRVRPVVAGSTGD